MDVNVRDFTRNFARYRAAAARGEKVRVTSKEGAFVFAREKTGITGAELLARLRALPPGAGIFDPGGADRIEAGRRMEKSAKSPWEA